MHHPATPGPRAVSAAATGSHARITAVILAGGRARRMGGEDKGLIEVADKPMVQHVAERLRPQADALLVNANRNAERYRALCGCPVIADRVGDFAGPLAGMASALEACATPLLLTAPCDSPLLAPDLGERLVRALERAGAEIAVARDGTRLHPVFALLQRSLLASLLAYLDGGGRKIDRWYASHRMVEVDFSDRAEGFLNVNTPEERAALEARMQEHAGAR